MFSRANKRKKIRRRRGTIPRKIKTTYNRKRGENNEEFRKVQTREKTRIDEITSGKSIFYEFYKNVYSTRNRRRTKKVNCETVEEIDNCYLASSDKGKIWSETTWHLLPENWSYTWRRLKRLIQMLFTWLPCCRYNEFSIFMSRYLITCTQNARNN